MKRDFIEEKTSVHWKPLKSTFWQPSSTLLFPDWVTLKIHFLLKVHNLQKRLVHSLAVLKWWVEFWIITAGSLIKFKNSQCFLGVSAYFIWVVLAVLLHLVCQLCFFLDVLTVLALKKTLISNWVIF